MILRLLSHFRPPASRSRRALTSVLCLLTSVLLLSSARAYEWQNSGIWESAIAERAFDSGPSWFSAGPAWLMNAMPGSHVSVARARAQYLMDGAGDREESTPEYNGYVGTLHDAFDVSLCNNVSTTKSSTAGGTVIWGTSSNWKPADPDGTWTANASGNWSDTTKWAGGIVADFGGFADFSTIDLTTNVTITIDLSSRIVRRIDVGDINHTNTYTIAANLGLSLIFDNTVNSANAQLNQTLNSANASISAPVTLNSSLDITNASAFSLNLSGGLTAGTAGTKTITTSSGVINSTGVIGNGSGVVAFVHNGPGILRLSAANTYSGGTTVNGGILELGTNGMVSITGTRMNGPVGTGGLTLNNGATLRSNNTSARTIQNDVILSGNITLGDAVNNGALTFNSTDGTRTLSTPSTVTLNADTTLTTNSLVTIADAISGGFKLTKNGGSTLILSGANTYTGTTTISGGTLQLGTGGTTGSLSTSSAIVDNANLTFNRTNIVTQGSDFSSAGITGTGSVTQAGTGTLLLTAANTYTGDTIIKAGELFLAPSGSLSSSSTIRLGGTTANSPSAMFTFGSTSGGITLTNPMTVQTSASGTEGTRTLLGLATSGNTNTYSGVITMNTGLTVQSAATGGSVTNGQGILLFQGGSINVGTSTLTVNTNLRGNNADTYSIQGIVTINELLSSSSATGGSVFKDGSGTLILEGTSNTYTGTNAAALNANGTRIGGGILGIFGDGSLGLAPSTGTDNVFFTVPGTNVNVDSIAPTLRADAAGITLAATRNINIASGVTGRFDSNSNTFTINGNINGAGNLNKTGAGTLILAGNNTYTGSTTITTGTLNAAGNGALGSGATGTSSVTVNSGGTLLISNSSATDRIRNDAPISLAGTIGRSGSGVVSEGAGATRNGATLPLSGSTVGLGALTLTANSTLNFDLLSTGGVGTLTFASLAPGTFTLNILNWSSNANFTTQTSGVDGTDDRLIFGGSPPASTSITFNGAPSAFLVLDPGFYEVVPLTPIPEPSTWIGAALALGAVGVMSRRRSNKKAEILKA
jgi:fibronectin-binding autotransporter adhesin